MGQEAIVETLPSWIGFLQWPIASSQAWMGGWLVSRCCAGGSVSLCYFTRAPLPETREWKKNTGMSKVCSEETRTGELDWYHKTCALIFKTDTWHCHFFFLDQWACQHRVVLCWDLIRNGRVYMSLQLAKNYSAASRKEAPLMVSHSTHFFFWSLFLISESSGAALHSWLYKKILWNVKEGEYLAPCFRSPAKTLGFGFLTDCKSAICAVTCQRY